MDETKYRVESEVHYEILDNLLYEDDLEGCEWAVSYVEKMLGDSAESLGLRIVEVNEGPYKTWRRNCFVFK